MHTSADLRPSDYEYALLSQHVYKGNALKKDDIVPNTKWRVLEVYPGQLGYFGALYVNDKTKQLVLAHRGTNSVKALIEDLVGVCNSQWDSLQKLSAYERTQHVVQLLQKKYPNYHLSFTGHSLGGYLAELSVFFCHRSLKYPQANTVSFESPGIKGIVEKLQPQHMRINLKALDIVGYVTYPDLLNTFDGHIGTLYRIDTLLSTNAQYPGFYTGEAHSKDKIVDFLQQPNITRELVVDWPIGLQYLLFFHHAEYDKKESRYVINDFANATFQQKSEEEYRRLHSTHYQTEPGYGNHNVISLRHLSLEMRDILKILPTLRLYTSDTALVESWKKIGIEGSLCNQLLNYELKKIPHGGDTLLVLPAGCSVQAFRENLATVLAKECTGYRVLLPINKDMSPAERDYVNAVVTAISQGVEIEKDATVKAKAQLIKIVMPEEIQESEIKTVEALIEKSMEAIRQNVGKLEVTGIAEGVKIHTGADVTAEATGVVIEMRGKEGKNKKDSVKSTATTNRNPALTEPRNNSGVASSNLVSNGDKSSRNAQGFSGNVSGGSVDARAYGEYYHYDNHTYNTFAKGNLFQTPEQLQTWPLQLPANNKNFVPRTDLMSQINEVLEPNQSSKPCVLNGLRGIGKTQLALQYLHGTKKIYKFRGWFDAKDEGTLLTEYRTLALIAGLLTEEEAKNPKVVKEQVLRWFNNQPGCLLIFDNAPKYDVIQSFIPTENAKIMVTSYSGKWHGNSRFFSIPVGVMTLEESITLLQQLIGYKASIEEFMRLAETLKRLPLALAQAAAYIHQRNQLMKYTINDYLREYQEERLELLKADTLNKDWVDTPHEPVAVTWSMNIDALRQKQPLAEKLLQFCAYFNGKDIQQTLLLACLRELQQDLNDLTFGNILQAINDYSLLTFDSDNNTVSMHELVQEVIKDQLTKQTQQEILSFAMQAIDEEASEREPTMEEIKRRTNLVPHMQSILQHSEKVFANLDDKTRGLLQLPLLLNLADIYSALSDGAAQKTLLERALTIQEAHYGKDNWQVARTLNNLANAYDDLGDAATQKALCECALVIEEAHCGKNHWQTAVTLENLANAYGALGDAVTKKTMLERVLAIQEAHYGKEHWIVAKTLVNLAAAYGDLGDVVTKKALLERALTIQEAHYGKEHCVVARTLGNLATACGALGDASTKKILCECALVIEEAHYGKEHWIVAKTLANLAAAYGDLGDAATQKALCERALAIQETHYGKDHWQVTKTLVILATAYGVLGDASTKKLLCERALVIEEAHYGKDHWIVAEALGNLATAYGDLGDAATQKALCERALAIQEPYYGKDHWGVARTLGILATAYGDLGDANTKKEMLECALAIQEAHFGKTHWQVAKTLANLGMAKLALGNEKSACEDLHKAYRIFLQHFGENDYRTKWLKAWYEKNCVSWLDWFFGHAKAEEILPTNILIE